MVTPRFAAHIAYPMARHDPRAVRPYTPGSGACASPPDLIDRSTAIFHGPSSTSHVRPSRSVTLVFAVPCPTDGRSEMAFALRSNAVLIVSARSMARMPLYYSRMDKTDEAWTKTPSPAQF